MKYIKRFNESEVEKYSIFDSKGWEKFLPKKLNLVTSSGNWTLELPPVDNNMGHPTNVANLMNCIQIGYYQNTPSKEDGNVNRDGEPDQLEFDITIVKDNNGSQANPDTLKLNVDITYGDSMAVEFSIEKPNKVNVFHYTGFGSKYDKDTFWGFEDDSLKELVDFFNSWGYQLTTKDFTFIDKYPDSYVHNESIKLSPSFNDEYFLVINNSKPQENRYLTNVLKYLDFRGIQYKVVKTPDEVERMKDEFNIIGAISTGSDYRITDPSSDEEFAGSEKSLSLLSCPIVAMCYGMQSMVKFHGGENKDSGEYIHGSYALTEYKDHELFSGLDMENTQFSFSFHDCPSVCPDGFEVIGKLNDKICAISNDSKKQYGLLFHPEDIEHTYKVLDNFVKMCKGGQDYSDDFMSDQKMANVVESYINFIKNRK
jgi:GMP synthase-like glutamine amidotransferase